jgi:YVTN family beta-propeller protein
MLNFIWKRGAMAITAGVWLAGAAVAPSRADNGYQIFVSNEKSGDLTVISSDGFKVVATIPVGKRPRGIRASPDGRTVYVALSGTPVEPPPQLDANGNPILLKNQDDDDDDKVKADKTADGIGLVDAVQRKFVKKIPAGSDPEQFVLNADGSRIYIANEDVGAATILDAASGKVITFVPVSREPEGVGVSPDGKFFYVTCETAGDVFAIDAQTYKVIGHLSVHPRPRSVSFLPDGSRAFIPSESVGELNVIDTASQKLLQVITLPKGCRPMTVRVSPRGLRVCGGCEDLSGARYHQSGQAALGHYFFAGWKIPVFGQRAFG